MATAGQKIGSIAIKAAGGVQEILVQLVGNAGMSGAAGLAGLIAAVMKVIVDLVAAFQRGQINIFNDYETPLLPYKSPEEEAQTQILRDYIRNIHLNGRSSGSTAKASAKTQVATSTNATGTTLKTFLDKYTKYLILGAFVALLLFVVVKRKTLLKWQ